MKTVKLLSILTLISILGCVENDIPYPVIKGSITSFEIQGEISSEINEVKREIIVTLEDTVNIKKAKVTKFSVSEKIQVINPIIAVGDYLDLRNTINISLFTYQDYIWKIIPKQDIKREFMFEGQVGVPTFNMEDKVAIGYISSESDITKVKVSSLKLGASNAITTPNPELITDFSMPQTFMVTNHGETEIWTVSILPTETTVETYVPSEIWARRVGLYGSAKIIDGVERGFEWKKSSDQTWTKVNQSDIKFMGSEMNAYLDFEPSTSYVYRSYLGTEYGEEKAFNTPSAPTIPNLTMDAWSANGKIALPYGEGETPFWITGNAGVTMFNDSNSQPTTDAVAGKAAKLQTVTVPVVGLAAGNLFTGDFITDMGNPLNSTKWGRPFIGRPRKLAGMFKYTQKTIDVAKNRPDAKGTPDKGTAWIKLEDWKGAVGLRPADAEELAYSILYFDKNVAEYTRFEFDVKYSSSKQPTHITICFSSSYLGDFYTGGVGSTLYIDNIELIY